MAKNRKEAFLAAIAGEDVGGLKPKNRQEAALDKIAKGAGGGGGGGGNFIVDIANSEWDGDRAIVDVSLDDILEAFYGGKQVLLKTNLHGDIVYYPATMVSQDVVRWEYIYVMDGLGVGYRNYFYGAAEPNKIGIERFNGTLNEISPEE